MKKDFDSWNEQKKKIHDIHENKLYHQRQIWWCSLGLNIGFEQDGTGGEYERPVLILKGLSRNTCLIIPLTSSPEKHKMRIPVGMIEERQASALLSQIKVIDTKRLINKIGFLEKTAFESIRKAAKDLL
ncbi:MAG: Toxin-antitoxin protein [Parcubacteria group bacterium GW2011_GWA2_49_9]|nr:MAG: Toxin-antitoxin protein [Parcubacteria group bacterium GW2011_GWA2_49_9]